MTTQEAKKIDLSGYLAELGYFPTNQRKNGDELWYSSPLNDGDTTPSFKITVSKNSWYDFSIEEGGSILDFVIKRFDVSVGEAFNILKTTAMNVTPVTIQPIQQPKPQHKLEIRAIKPLQNKALCQYLTSRNVSVEVSKRYLKEVYYKQGKRNFFALGMFNNSGGYEVRCAIFKGCVGAKDITSFCKPENDTLSVFEGFMDYLSILTDKEITGFKSDVIILHSTNNLHKAIAIMAANKYTKIYGFFDNDDSGKKAFTQLSKIHPSVRDMSYLYRGFNDYNDFLKCKSQ